MKEQQSLLAKRGVVIGGYLWFRILEQMNALV